MLAVDGTIQGIYDRYGHRAGDDVLVEVARRLRGAVRQEDLVARYGGDEFVLLQEGVDSAQATATLERVRDLCRAPIELSSGDVVQVSVSAGHAGLDGDDRLELARHSLDADAGDLDELLHRADLAMYREKPHRAMSVMPSRSGG